MVFLNELFQKLDLKIYSKIQLMPKTHANYTGGKKLDRYRPQIQNQNTCKYLGIVPETVTEVSNAKKINIKFRSTVSR